MSLDIRHTGYRNVWRGPSWKAWETLEIPLCFSLSPRLSSWDPTEAGGFLWRDPSPRLPELTASPSLPHLPYVPCWGIYSASPASVPPGKARRNQPSTFSYCCAPGLITNVSSSFSRCSSFRASEEGGDEQSTQAHLLRAALWKEGP